MVSLELVYSNQKRLKRYNLLRSTLSDCDYNESEGSCSRFDVACFSNLSASSATWHDPPQSYGDEGDDWELDTQGPFYHA